MHGHRDLPAEQSVRVERTAGRLRVAELPAALREELLARARAAAPREACGVMLGARAGDRTAVRAVFEAQNLARGAERFELDPGDVVRAERVARARGLELVGFWHSHPRGPASPSAEDARAAWPGHLHVIVAPCACPRISVWLSAGGRLEGVGLITPTDG